MDTNDIKYLDAMMIWTTAFVTMFSKSASGFISMQDDLEHAAKAEQYANRVLAAFRSLDFNKGEGQDG